MFRTTTPKRRANRAVCKNYTSYRKTLTEDFNNKCGYCDDYDLYRIRSFTIDHFFPQHPENKSIPDPIPSNNYYNLVYCCSYCNSAKSNKWYTLSSGIHNEKNIGFVDPCFDDYAVLFLRDQEGRIKPNSQNKDLAEFILNNLKLWLPIHSLMWRVNKLHTLEIKVRDKLESISESDSNFEELKQQHYDIMYIVTDLFSKIFLHNE